MSGTEGQVAIETKTVNIFATLGHILSGTTSFIIGKGLALVPFQNYKTHLQLEEKGPFKNPLSGSLIEIPLHFVSLFARITTNTLTNKLIGCTFPSFSSLIASACSWPFARQRVLQRVGKKEDDLLKGLIPYLAFGVTQDLLWSYLNPICLQIPYQEVVDQVFLERAAQSALLAGIIIVLTPLEMLYKGQLVSKDEKVEKMDWKQKIKYYFRGWWLAIPEAFSTIFLKYLVYRIANCVFDPQ